MDKYTWVDVGSSFLPSDLLSAFLMSQLEFHLPIQAHRRRVWEYYDANLRGWAAAAGVGLPTIPAHCEQSYHMYYLLLPSLVVRQRLIAHLRSKNVMAVFHYLPLHLWDMGHSFGGRPGDCPVTEDVSDRLLRLPFYNTLSPIEQERVVGAIAAFR